MHNTTIRRGSMPSVLGDITPPAGKASGPVALVLGGNGFIGRYTVSALQDAGATIVIGTRGKAAGNTKESLSDTEKRVVRLHECVEVSDWIGVLGDVDVVINSVGILRERKNESFDAVHHKAVAALAKACRLLDVVLVHVSALGIDDRVASEFSLSKLRGEKAIADSACRATVVRASVVDADDGYGSGWFRRVAQWPVYLMPARATRNISPIAAVDLGECLCRIALSDVKRTDRKTCRLIEVSSGDQLTLKDYLLRLRTTGNPFGPEPWFTVTVPNWLAKLSAKVFDVLHITPYSIGHHELLQFDNVPKQNALPAILGRVPTRIGAAGPVDKDRDSTAFASDLY